MAKGDLKRNSMTRFVILLGGDIDVTERLRRQVAGGRAIAADGGMRHAEALRLDVELWVGDFDSTLPEIAEKYFHIPQVKHPAEKDATDGEIAVAHALERGASEFVLVGGLGGQADHVLGHFGLALRLAGKSHRVLITSGHEEAYPFIAGKHVIDVPVGSRISLIPFSDVTALDLTGVKWPLKARDVTLGSSLTMSNIATGPVEIDLNQGYGIAVAYPAGV
jgi:thiamine pyrophosphokinase